DNFQGTGTWEPAPMLYAATPSLSLGHGVGLQAYANGGVELNGDDVERSAGRFGFGLDCAVKERFTAAVAMLGREPFQGIAPPGFFDVARVDPRTGQRFMAAVLGLQRDRASAYDLSLGGRMNLWHDTVFGFANVILPLTRDGRRSGLEAEEERDLPPDPLAEETGALAAVASASVQGRVALGGRAGRRVLRLGRDPDAPWITSRGPGARRTSTDSTCMPTFRRRR